MPTTKTTPRTTGYIIRADEAQTTADLYKFYQSKSGKWWVWNGDHWPTCMKVRLSIWWDKMFGKPFMTISGDFFK